MKLLIDNLKIERKGWAVSPTKWQATCYVDGVYHVNFGATKRGALTGLFYEISTKQYKKLSKESPEVYS